MNNQFSVWGMAALTIFVIGCAPTGSDTSSVAGAGSLKAEGSAYHEVYSKIARTLVTVQDFDIRTDAGEVIHLDTKPMAVDLQMLSGFSQGLKLDLTGVRFPDGASEIRVAEIKTHIVSSAPARIEIADDGGKCDLRDLPKNLVLYTAQPITLANDVYHVKVSFSALASIQIDYADEMSCKDRSVGSEQVCQIANYRQLVPGIPLAVDDTF